jgi:hypothetical protein
LLTKRGNVPFLCALITDPVDPEVYPKTFVIVKEYGANHTITLIGAVGLRTVPPFVMICGGGPSQKFVPSNDTVTYPFCGKVSEANPLIVPVAGVKVANPTPRLRKLVSHGNWIEGSLVNVTAIGEASFNKMNAP